LPSNLPNEEVINVQPYEQIGEFYDQLMSHVKYKEWADYINKIIKKQKSDISTLLDISCGTGTLALFLEKIGYSTFGSDISKSMIMQAAQKIRYSKCKVQVFQCDMRRLAVKQTFGAVICLYDSINYALAQDDFVEILNQVYGSLFRKGLFIFDVCTEYNSLKYFYDYHDSGETEGFWYYRHSYYSPESKLQNNIFRILSKKNKKIYIENHQQRIYLVSEILKMIASTKFKIKGMYKNYSFNKPDEKSERIHFVLKKNDSD